MKNSNPSKEDSDYDVIKREIAALEGRWAGLEDRVEHIEELVQRHGVRLDDLEEWKDEITYLLDSDDEADPWEEPW